MAAGFKSIIMKKCLIALLIIAFFYNSNAQNSLIDLASITKPKPETFSHQVETLKKWKVDTANLFLFDGNYIDSMGASLSYTLDTHMYRWQDFSPMQFRIYDKKGMIYTGWQYCFGALDKLGVLIKDSVVDIKRMPINRTLTFQSDLKLFGKNANNLPISQDVCEQYDYVIVAFWASYYGRSARKMMQYIQKFVDNSDSKKVLFIKVNYNGTDGY
jgi:hypothetical protein